jgi:hypothetical protein
MARLQGYAGFFPDAQLQVKATFRLLEAAWHGPMTGLLPLPGTVIDLSATTTPEGATCPGSLEIQIRAREPALEDAMRSLLPHDIGALVWGRPASGAKRSSPDPGSHLGLGAGREMWSISSPVG